MLEDLSQLSNRQGGDLYNFSELRKSVPGFQLYNNNNKKIMLKSEKDFSSANCNPVQPVNWTSLYLTSIYIYLTSIHVYLEEKY